MKKKVIFEVQVEQAPDRNNLYFATKWYVDDVLKISSSQTEPLPSTVSLELELPCKVRIFLEGQSNTDKRFSIIPENVCFYVGKLKYPLTPLEAEEIFNNQIHYTTEEDVNNSINLNFKFDDPLKWRLDQNSLNLGYLTPEQREVHGITLGASVLFQFVYDQRKNKNK